MKSESFADPENPEARDEHPEGRLEAISRHPRQRPTERTAAVTVGAT